MGENTRVPAATALVVIPTFNEAENLRRLLPQLLELPIDILVVDDASSDGSADAAREIPGASGRIEILERPAKLGLGSAYRDGFARALNLRYSAIMQMDADGSHRVVDLQRMYQYFTSHPESELIIGSRWIPGGKVENWPRRRKILSRTANLYSKAVLALPIKDSTAGFRIYRAELLERMNLGGITSEGYAFQIEMTREAERVNAKIIEIPITFIEREIGVSKMSGEIVREALVKVTMWGVARLTRQISGK
jgi:dolichol-phosphate mannosyltransferase